MGLHVTSTFSASFYGGSALAPDVPGKWMCALDGRPYMIDTLSPEWAEESVPLLRPQADQGLTPSEASLNPEALWRRSTEGWHHGAGQNYHDAADSDPYRFRESKGIDVWTRKQAGLLPSTDQKKASANTNLKVVPCGSRLFLVDGATVQYTEDVSAGTPTWVDCTNEPGGTILDIASDGHFVWITDGSNSFWADSTASPPAFNLAGWTGTQDADVLGFVKGRLMSGHDNTLHTYDASGAASAVTMATTLHTTFAWVGFAGGPGNRFIYAAGHDGDKSLIFRIGIKEDGTGLDAAIPCGELPDGEVVRSIGSYLGFILLGTDTGVRFAVASDGGDLTIGALLETGKPCRCFEGQEQFVWFGWDNYDATSTGLGRLSLEEFAGTDNLAPAYASDLMVTAQGAVLSVCTFEGLRVFTVSGSGVWAQDTPLVPLGTLYAGRVTFGLTEVKTSLFMEVRHRVSGSGSTSVGLIVDDGAGSTIGVLEADGTLPTGEARGREFELQFSISRNESATSECPLLSSVTLLSTPAAQRTAVKVVPFLFARQIKDRHDKPEPFDCDFHLNAIRGLWDTGQVVLYQEGNETSSVVIEDFKALKRPPTGQQGGNEPSGIFEGTVVVKMKTVTGG